MKPVNMLIKLLFSAILLLSVSCNSGEDKKNSKASDSTASAMAAQPATPKEIMIIKHKVANYAKWKPGYDSDDSVRVANGLHNHIVSRGVEDSNMVMIVMYMDDANKAKAFAANPKLKEVMQKAGVTGVPEMDYVHRVMNDTTNTQQTARVMIKHKVKDWDAWKKVFDDHKQARMDAGLTDKMVGYTVGDNHMVTLVCVVSDMVKAKAFMNSKDLADKMKAGGVEGPPSVFFYNVVQKY